MAASGYDIPQSSPFGSRYDQRRSSGSMTGIYDRSANAPPNRRSASPPSGRRAYDSYVPPRSAPVFREDSNPYHHPNVYRPEYAARPYYGGRSPSIERYSDHPRTTEPDHWDRQTAWQPQQQQSGWSKHSSWQEPLPPSPTGSSRSRGRDEILATRMYEPSDSWKQANSDRVAREDGPSSYPNDRYIEPSPRIMDSLNDNFVRPNPRSSYVPGGDRYRSASIGKRPSYSNTRSDYDSYRPSYVNKRENRGSFHRETSPPRSYRTDPPLASSWDHREPISANSRLSGFISRSRSRSPERRFNGRASPSPQRPESSSGRPVGPDTAVKQELSRRSSRSSIASTQVSDTQLIIPAAPIPQKPLDTSGSSTKIADFAKSSTPVWSPNSPAPSTPVSATGQQSQLSGPQAVLANRFKSLHSASVPPSPLSTEILTVDQRDSSLYPSSSIKDNESKNHANGQKSITTPSVSQPPASGNGSMNGHTSPVSLKQDPSPEPVKQESPPSDLPKSNDAQEETVNELPRSLTNGTPIHPPAPEVPEVADNQEGQPPEDLEKPHDQPPSLSTFAFSPFKSKSQSQSNAISSYHNQNASPVESEPPLEKRVLLELQPLFPPDALPLSDKPSLANAKTLGEALRSVAMTRLLCDQQTRDELVNPVLNANRAIAGTEFIPIPTADSTPHQLIQEIHHKLDETVDYNTIGPSLAEYFEQRQAMVNEKVHQLSNEYLFLHKKWKAHCSSLNTQSRSHGPEGDFLLHGRTTRRTSAFTDAVRSDLEMEQVIASLGVDDLTDANYLSSRNAARIPDMISVTQGKIDYLFDDTNHLVENPREYYAPHTGIDDWTEEEKRIFLDRFAMFPKQFGLIAESLPHKTAAQCVDYYYLHKKRMIDFRRVVSQLAPGKRKRRGGGKKKGNALLADIAQHDAEVGKDHMSTFIVPSRVAKGKRRGRAAAVSKAHSSTPAASADRYPVTANATPQPELILHQPQAQLAPSTPAPESIRLEQTPLATPTPEPEGRSRRSRKPPVSQAPTPDASMPPPSAAPTPKPEAVSAFSVSEAEPKVRKARRGRKQVKSAAIIVDEPPSPPPEFHQELPPPTSAVSISAPGSPAAAGKSASTAAAPNANANATLKPPRSTSPSEISDLSGWDT